MNFQTTADWIEILFGVVGWVGQQNNVLDGNLAPPLEWEMFGVNGLAQTAQYNIHG